MAVTSGSCVTVAFSSVGSTASHSVEKDNGVARLEAMLDSVLLRSRIEIACPRLMRKLEILTFFQSTSTCPCKTPKDAYSGTTMTTHRPPS